MFSGSSPKYENQDWMLTIADELPRLMMTRDQVADLDPLRMPAIHERLHQLDLFVGTHLGDLARFGGVEPEWFLAQNMLPGAGRRHGPGCMVMVGERVVDGVDIRIVEKFLVAAIGARDRHRGGRLLGAVEPAGGDRHQVAVRGALQGRDHPLPPDLGCAQHSPSDLARHGPSLA